jgi:uncharacterized phage protein gp47/JayE
MADTGYTPPTQSELIARIESDYNAKTNNEDARVDFSPGWIFTRVLAGAVRSLHDAVAYGYEQILPTTAAEFWLGEHAKIRGVSRIAATFASGDLVFTGTNGTTLPAGTEVQRVEDGVSATVTIGGTVVAGTVTVTVQADEAGAAPNSVAGVKWELAGTVAGIDAEGEVDATTPITGGQDEESLEDWRERILIAWRQPPGAGTVADYERWAREVSGVDRVFVEPLEFGAGTVGVRFVVDGDGVDSNTIIPSPAEIAAVEAAIDANRPVTAAVTVTALVASQVNFTIQVEPSGLASVEQAIEDELNQMFIRLAAPSSSGYIIQASQISAAISSAEGEEYHIVTSPAGAVAASANEVLTLGTVTFV